MAEKKTKRLVHKDLGEFKIEVNEFGQLETNMNINKLNDFLDKHVNDKKFEDKPVQRAAKKKK